MNPFFSGDLFPAFDRLTPQDARTAIPELAKQAEQAVSRIEKNCAPTWDARITGVSKAVKPLFHAWHLVHHMLSTCNSQEWREAEEALQPVVIAASLRIAQSKPLYEALCALRGSSEFESLEEGKKRVVEAQLRDARDSGIALEGTDRERFNEIIARLSELSMKFSNNTLDATKAFSLTITNRKELAGIPPAVLELCAEAARRAGSTDATAEAGPWRLTLEQAIYAPLMQYAENRALREQLYRARVTRATSGTLDNRPVITEILALRRELSNLVSFPTYAQLALDSRMARSPEAVYEMISSIGDAANKKAKTERRELQDFAAENGFSEMLKPWDTAYWSCRHMEALFGFSSETLRPYFPFPRVLKGLFSLASELFGITIEEADGLAPVWQKDVRFFCVKDSATGKDVAHFYLDPYSRPETKRGGAWMDSLFARDRAADGSLRLPLTLLCCNQAPATEQKPSLMTLDEVTTLFHEFGHALQDMLTRVDYEQASGINNVEWDAVEVASQFLEKWCSHPTILRTLSEHVDTREPLPEDLISRIQAAETYRQGSDTIRQLTYALVDMDLHEKVPCSEMPSADAAYAAAAARFPFSERVEGENPLATFTHIFSGGYAAGYYSYMWANVLSYDLFAAFDEAGFENKKARAEMGRRYAETFLALGGSVDPAEVFRLFRGRAPSSEALLRYKGLLPS